jgi:hypothetical protein
MAASKIGWEIWFGCLVLLWSVYPCAFAQARSVLLLSIITALLGLLGGGFRAPVLVIWSAGVGLCNLTLALLLSSYPPALWVGVSAGILLLALVDSGQRLTYLRHCWLAPGVMTALLRPFVRLSGTTVLANLGLGLLVFYLSTQVVNTVAPGLLTVVGACFLAGFLALFLLYTNHWPNG